MREMKDSGVPWLKEIPVSWKVERGKNVLVLQKRPVRENDEVVTCFRDGEVILRSLRRTEGFTMSDKEIGYQGINEGDIVIHGMDGFAGAMGVSKSTGKGSPVLIVCTPKYDAIPQYIIYYLRALAMTDVFVALATGIRERSCDLRWNKVSELEFIMPSSSEQQKIVEFLDRKCAEVDEMIGLQEQIIEELKAYKQSVITEAVTKGLNPNAPMRDSGIEWIGQIPEHWETHPFKAFYKTTKGLNITKENLVESGKPVISYGQIHSKLNSGVRVDEALIRFVPEEYLTTNPECLSKQHDLFFADTSEDREGAGNVVYIDIDTPIFAGYHTIIARPSEKVKSKYFAYLIQTDAWRCQLRSRVSGVKVFSISQKFINQTSVIIPPISEQQAIADYLDEKCADIDSLIQTKQSKIDSLKEYKKSIIYEYVTGKREVE